MSKLSVVAPAQETFGPGERTPEEWAAYVREPAERAAGVWIETGRRLIEAEEALKLRGETGVMALYEALGYGPDKGQRLKGIARNERFAHAAHARHLPMSWMTLHELTRLTEPQWEYGLRTGIIRPDMERKDVARIKAISRKEKSPHRLNAGESGSVKLYQRDAVEFLGGLKEGSVDLLLTDPPYMTDLPEGEDIAAFARWWVPPALARVKATGRAYIFAGAYPAELHAYLSVLLAGDHGLTLGNVLVWTYRNTLGPSPSHDYKLTWQACFHLYGPEAEPLDVPVMLEQLTVQEVNAPDARTGIRHHAWQKPEELAERLVRHSTFPGDMVLDPFAGTGTFLAAAARLGRDGLGCDNDPAMLALCRERGLVVADAG